MEPTDAQSVAIPITHKVEGVVLDEIRDLAYVLPAKRMRSLMLDNAPADWGQISHSHAAKVLDHLKKLSSFYFDFNNVIIGWHEGFSHPGINPRGQASVVPQLVERLSHEFWEL